MAMDQLSYQYGTANNQLQYVQDDIPASNCTEDIDAQNSGNYAYDKIGNLVKDKNDIITWTVYGKIKSVSKGGA